MPGLGVDGYLVETPTGAVLGFGDIYSHGGIDGDGVGRRGHRHHRVRARLLGCDDDRCGHAFWGRGLLRPGREEDVTGIAALPDGKGYWIVTKTGTVQAFGQAQTYPGKSAKGLLTWWRSWPHRVGRATGSRAAMVS